MVFVLLVNAATETKTATTTKNVHWTAPKTYACEENEWSEIDGIKKLSGLFAPKRFNFEKYWKMDRILVIVQLTVRTENRTSNERLFCKKIEKIVVQKAYRNYYLRTRCSMCAHRMDYSVLRIQLTIWHVDEFSPPLKLFAMQILIERLEMAISSTNMCTTQRSFQNTPSSSENVIHGCNPQKNRRK